MNPLAFLLMALMVSPGVQAGRAHASQSFGVSLVITAECRFHEQTNPNRASTKAVRCANALMLEHGVSVEKDRQGKTVERHTVVF